MSFVGLWQHVGYTEDSVPDITVGAERGVNKKYMQNISFKSC